MMIAFYFNEQTISIFIITCQFLMIVINDYINQIIDFDFIFWSVATLLNLLIFVFTYYICQKNSNNLNSDNPVSSIENEKLYKYLMNILPEGIAVINKKGDLVYKNK